MAPTSSVAIRAVQRIPGWFDYQSAWERLSVRTLRLPQDYYGFAYGHDCHHFHNGFRDRH